MEGTLMTRPLLVDYSFTVPTPAAIRAAGYSGVIRYLSPDPGKNLSPHERDGLLEAGLSITLVWESTGGRAGQGQAAGAVDAHAAEKQASTLGYPGTCPLFYADDSGQLNAAAIAPYFDGVESATTYPVGIYGSLAVIQGIKVPWKWQTSAWSGVDRRGNGLVSPQAHLYQREHPTVAHPLAGTDENVVLLDFPRWAAALPAPPPAPSEDTMLVIVHATPPQPAHWLSDGLTKRVITSTAAEAAWIAAGVPIVVLPQAEIDAIE
jgi:hypothetical protein